MASRPEPQSSWLWNHIGRISGLILLVLGIFVFSFLAAIGYGPAYFALMLFLAGLVILVIGGEAGPHEVTQFRDEGIALRTIRLGEADRIVTFITPEHGKVRAVAKGVRKTKSRIGARVEPLTHVSLLCWRGRELDVVTQVEVLDSFRTVREDLERLSAAMTMLEIADQVAVERHAAPELFALLLGALRELERANSPFLLGAFCFRLLEIEGVAPSVDSCHRCGEENQLVAYDSETGGFVCSNCRRGNAVSGEVLEIVRGVLGGRLARVLREAPTEAAPAFEHLATNAVEHHLDRRLRSMRHLVRADRRGA